MWCISNSESPHNLRPNMENLGILMSLFFLFSFSTSLHPSSHSNLQNHCLDDQRSTLLQLQHHLYYAPNFTFSSKLDLWDPNTRCCSWKGVTCDALGHVIGIDLSCKNLSGSFHSIFNLHHLQRLNLAGNNFNTTLFQYGFGKLPNLTHLNLSASCFHSQIPVGISYLTRLVSLNLSYQDDCYWRNDQSFASFDPTLKLEKPNFKTFIKNMRSLRELYLDGVNISSQSSEWCETTSLSLPKLSVLSMSGCGLTGPFCSSLLNLRYLSKLNLDSNPISYLPPKFSKISSPLVSLRLVDCNLSGHFPAEFFLLPKMQRIDISDNSRLMGQLPEFPINNTLEVLSLQYTNFSGSIPASIANLSNLVELDLSDNNFNGSIPPFHRSGVPNLASLDLSWNHLSGSIPSSLFTLSTLQTLSLGYNSFSDCQLKLDMFLQLSNLTRLDLSNISLFIGSNNKIRTLPQLESLYLRSCNLTEFPEFIKSQNKLTDLDLSNNRIHGLVLNWLWKSTLEILDLSSNAIDIPNQFPFDDANSSFPMLRSLFLESCNISTFPAFLKSQESLEELDLSNNQISGAVPNWLWKSTLIFVDLSSNAIDIPNQFPFDDANSSFPMLISLRLRSCNISTFPAFLKSQESLEELDLSNNQISGAVPNWVWKKSLQYLDLSNNSLTSLDQFSSNQDSLQIPICNLSHLWRFDASFNELSGSIPSCLGNISSLEYLDLQQNSFSGSIPDFGGATQLSTLELNDNKLEGKLPRSLANCTMLYVLNLENNTLHDTFPLWLGKLPVLTVLILRANRFYGPIKHLENNFPVLDVLDIASNNFSGHLSIKFFHATHQLRSLKIGGNKLEGKLPRSLANCKKLEVLDVGKNMIHDTFPNWLVKLPSLMVLILRSNKFYGSIHFSGDGNAFPMLHILDLASNNFSGEVSVEFFQSLRAMMVIDGNKSKPSYVGDNSYYQDSVTIVNKGFEINYQKILTLLTCLDLSNNNFHGRILEEIQDLKSLHVLNLSYNSFFDSIPSALGSLTELESLDLSFNKLFGKIPPQLTSLTFLAALNLSYNQLEGSIPQSNQFGTFLNDSYIGNPRLCGVPLMKKCNEVGSQMLPPKVGEDSWIDCLSVWKVVLMGYGCGLVIGFSIGYTVLNEFGNKWMASFIRNWNRKRRRSM
ncbi:hypothetical protein PVK06_034965 [Gossypium arboreum]|uniref:Leucine-rich repeat-containing N-terminal plant-type domain-containing protein n=1 Tax=Gossypium arboreum TaxID=29729 RepID=A0ABR0NFM2_GOSAR|nr:hypothetical protein PVK06_034965 [Gossypium arboreum]